MDSITEESPLATVLLLWDYAERLLDVPGLSYHCVLLVTHVTLFGPRWDLLVPLILWSYENRAHVAAFVFSYFSLESILVLAVCVSIAALTAHLIFRPLAQASGEVLSCPAKPYLVPCRITHSRLYPKKHSFSYSYLLVGIPVGLEANVNGVISTDVSGTSRAWYDVDAPDHLQRDSGHLGLRGKLDNYLKSQGADPLDYPHAYLLTAARFAGYHFNPVSFWYLYSQDLVLSAIVLEVNNTFGERRPYLVLPDLELEAKDLPSNHTSNGLSDGLPQSRIRNSWAKDFHVSPFNSRKGDYSLLTSDPLDHDTKKLRGLDITINLSSSSGRPKLVARLFSEGTPIDPSAMTALGKMRFLLQWFWVGFMTFPRIAKEAFTLFFKHGLHVWYRPEPLKESLSRYANATEGNLETVFRRYLKHLVEHATEPLVVNYMPSGIPHGAEETFTSSVATSDVGTTPQRVSIKILTPVFYSRFAGYAHDFEAVFCELVESCTIWVDRPDMLPKIFLKKQSPPLQSSSALDFAIFKMIQNLRRRPDVIKRPMTSAETANVSTRPVDIRDFRISSMDAFVLGHGDHALKRTYQAAVIQLFVAERFFFGYVEAVRMLWLACRLGLSLVLAVIATEAFKSLLSV